MEDVSFYQGIQELPSMICNDGELELDYDPVLIV